jgi:excisionase family DNA binding protein
MNASDYMTVAEVKDYLNISQAAAYALTKRKDFPVSRFGGCIRIPKQAFLAWVEEMTTIPSGLASRMRTA